MSLPIYQHYNLKSASLEDLEAFLKPDLNLRHPVVINLKIFTLDQQRDIVGLIENYYVSNNYSYKFPYPIYVMTEHESTISKMPIVKETAELPKFYSHAESRMNVKETHLIGKNRLLQIEIRNTDSLSTATGLTKYGHFHREVVSLEEERLFYRSIITKLTTKAKK